MKPKKGQCRIKRCENNLIVCRGVCAYHYYLMLDWIREEKTTWSALRKRGMINEAPVAKKRALLYNQLRAK